MKDLVMVTLYLGSRWYSALCISNTIFHILLLLLLLEILLGCWHFEFSEKRSVF